MKKQKNIVIEYFNSNTVDLIKDKKDITIYLWKYAIKTWHETKDITQFQKTLEANNITVVYFEDRLNYLNKPQWVIADENGEYWTGSWASHPFGGRARVFLKYIDYAKKYFSEKVAINAAEKMKENGVFGKEGKYTIELVKK